MTDERKQELIDNAIESAVRAYHPTEITTKDVLCIVAGCLLGTAISCHFEYSDINRRLKKLETKTK